MKEAIFCTELKNSFNESGCFAYKVPDNPIFKDKPTRFHQKKPFDMNVNIGGLYVAIECKMSKKIEGLSTRKVEEHQVAALDRVLETGGLSYVFWNIRVKADKTRGIDYVNSCVILPWREFKEIGLIPVKDVREKYIPEGIQGKNGRFDVSSFIEMVRRTRD